MKRFRYLLLSVITASALAASAVAQMTSREFERIDTGKITKNQAEHLVLKRYPGAKVKKATLRHRKNHSFWDLALLMPGAHNVTKVEVDGRSGKINTPTAAR